MTAPDPSSAGTAHRGAHLRGLPGLLPARDLAGAAEAAGGRADTPCRARRVRRDPDAGRLLPDHGQAHLDPDPPHRIEHRSEAARASAQPRSAPATPSPDHRHPARPARSRARSVVKTFSMPPLKTKGFFPSNSSSCESWARAPGATHSDAYAAGDLRSVPAAWV